MEQLKTLKWSCTVVWNGSSGTNCAQAAVHRWSKNRYSEQFPKFTGKHLPLEVLF